MAERPRFNGIVPRDLGEIIGAEVVAVGPGEDPDGRDDCFLILCASGSQSGTIYEYAVEAVLGDDGLPQLRVAEIDP